MSEEDIKGLEPLALKDFITECALKSASMRRAKKDYMKAFNDVMKKIDAEQALAMDVLEGKDSALARKILIEVQSILEQK